MLMLLALIYVQIVTDWHLLFLATCIIMIEVIFIVPLLSLTYVNGDLVDVVRDGFNPPVVNVGAQCSYYAQCHTESDA